MIQSDRESDDQFIIKCSGYAETCRLELLHQGEIPRDESDKTMASSKKNKYRGDPTDDQAMVPKHIHFPEGMANKDAMSRHKQDVMARIPRFERRLIPMTAVFDVTKDNGAICPRNMKMAVALGVDNSDCNLSELISEDKNILCDKALECLLKHTSAFRAKYASEFEKLLVKQMSLRFDAMQSLLEDAL